jgi:hypothetical protein
VFFNLLVFKIPALRFLVMVSNAQKTFVAWGGIPFQRNNFLQFSRAPVVVHGVLQSAFARWGAICASLSHVYRPVTAAPTDSAQRKEAARFTDTSFCYLSSAAGALYSHPALRMEKKLRLKKIAISLASICVDKVGNIKLGRRSEKMILASKIKRFESLKQKNVTLFLEPWQSFVSWNLNLNILK